MPSNQSALILWDCQIMTYLWHHYWRHPYSLFDFLKSTFNNKKLFVIFFFFSFFFFCCVWLLFFFLLLLLCSGYSVPNCGVYFHPFWILFVERAALQRNLGVSPPCQPSRSSWAFVACAGLIYCPHFMLYYWVGLGY